MVYEMQLNYILTGAEQGPLSGGAAAQLNWNTDSTPSIEAKSSSHTVLCVTSSTKWVMTANKN